MTRFALSHGLSLPNHNVFLHYLLVKQNVTNLLCTTSTVNILLTSVLSLEKSSNELLNSKWNVKYKTFFNSI